jgi:hypothetical protein
MRNWNNTLSWIVVALALPMVGCMGATSPSDSSSDELLAADGGQLGSLEEDDWQGALPGCDGILEGDESFAIASAEYGLVAALGADGAILCVDTVEAVEDELEETGHPEEADELVTAYAATIRALDMAGDPGARFRSRDHEGDPDPQPNTGWTRFQQAGDPDPQPNSGM